MSATLTAARRPQARGAVFGRALAAEVTKTATLRGWWIGAGLFLVLTTLFAALSTGQLVTDVGALTPGQSFRDFDGSQVFVQRAVLDAVQFPTFQSAAFFLPIAIAVSAGHEYRRRQILVSAIAVPSRLTLFAAKLVTVLLAGAGLCLAGCLLSAAVLVIMLPARLDAVVLSPAALAGPFRIALYGIAAAVLAAALTSILRSTLYVLIGVLVLFLLASTNVLAGLSPTVQQAIPLAGARAFLLHAAPDPGALGPGGGLLLLIIWTVVPAAAWGIVFVRRDLA